MNVVVKLRNFLARNKTKLLASGLVITTTYALLLMRNKNEWDKFLKDHDLYDEYYTPDADES